MRYLIVPLLVLSASLCASTVNAIVIDNFTVAQFSLIANNATPDVNDASIDSPSDILGRERDVRLQRTGSGAANSSVNYPLGGLLLVPGGSSPVTVTLQYDGLFDSGSTAIDIDGLPVTNLTASGANLISMPIVGGAVPVSATFTIWDSVGNSATNALVIPAGYSGDLLFVFDDFTPTANLSQARALQLQFMLPAGITFDITGPIQTDNIFFGTPEPSMLTILSPLLAGMAWKRRRAAAKRRSR